MSKKILNKNIGEISLNGIVCQLASRFKRFSAIILNQAYWIIFSLPIVLLVTILNQISISLLQIGIISALLSILTFPIIQLIVMMKYKRTLGDLVVGIRLLNYKTGENISLLQLIFREVFIYVLYGVSYSLVSVMPTELFYFSLFFPIFLILIIILDCIFPFIRKDKRTLSDLIFGTIAVRD